MIQHPLLRVCDPTGVWETLRNEYGASSVTQHVRRLGRRRGPTVVPGGWTGIQLELSALPGARPLPL